MKLALGTVQFGLDYGIANTSGQVSPQEAVAILDLAQLAGMDTLDTAIAYGDSEAALGRIGVKGWRIVSKLPGLPDECPDVGRWVREQVRGALARLGVERLHAVLLHRPDQLFGGSGPALLAALREIRDEGFADKIGVSVYTPAELDRLFDLARFDMVQAPLNIFDRRLVTTGWAQRLKALDVELHTRSSFLQGLLLLPGAQRPEKFGRWQPLWEVWTRWLSDSGTSALEACLQYPMSISEVDRVIVGVDSALQLREILKASSGSLAGLPELPEPIDEALLNPAAWNQL